MGRYFVKPDYRAMIERKNTAGMWCYNGNADEPIITLTTIKCVNSMSDKYKAREKCQHKTNKRQIRNTVNTNRRIGVDVWF